MKIVVKTSRSVRVMHVRRKMIELDALWCGVLRAENCGFPSVISSSGNLRRITYGQRIIKYIYIGSDKMRLVSEQDFDSAGKVS